MVKKIVNYVSIDIILLFTLYNIFVISLPRRCLCSDNVGYVRLLSFKMNREKCLELSVLDNGEENTRVCTKFYKLLLFHAVSICDKGKYFNKLEIFSNGL